MKVMAEYTVIDVSLGEKYTIMDIHVSYSIHLVLIIFITLYRLLLF